MAQAVSRRPPTSEARVRSRASPCGIFGGQSGTGTGFSPEYFGFPVNSIPPVLHQTEKRKKKLIIFIPGLYNKPQGCGASVACAAGPFSTKKKQSPSASKKIFSIVWKAKIHFSSHKSPPFAPILTQINPMRSSPSYFHKISFNITYSEIFHAVSFVHIFQPNP